MARAKTSTTKLSKSVKGGTPLKSTKPDSNLKRPDDPKLLHEKPYRCAMCGTRYAKLKGNFSGSTSPLYKGNMEGVVSYMPVCRTCLYDLYNHYAVALCDEREAMRRICMKFDIYFSDSVFEMSKNVHAGFNRISSYMSKVNLASNVGKTYDDTLDSEMNVTIDTPDDMTELDGVEIPNEALRVFGYGYQPEEYLILDQHYKMLKEQIEDDFIQETLIRDLCDIKVQIHRVKKQGSKMDVREYEVLTKLYQSTLGNANLKPKDKSSGINSDSGIGLWIKDIEKYAPAEYFADKELYDDFDGIKEYCERFIFRPLKNLFTGSKDKDKEFNIDPVEGTKKRE